MINSRRGSTSECVKATCKQQIRRAKSRDAARTRREKESSEIAVLAQSLPLPLATVSKLDKSSVIRLATSYMLCRELANFGLSKDTGSYKINDTFAGDALEALSGFIFIVTPTGKIIYISDNVASYLGLSSVDLCGLSIYDYLHAADAQEFSNNIQSACADLISTYRKELTITGKWLEIFIRMKSAICKNQTISPKSPDYKTLRCTGRCSMQFRPSFRTIRNDVNATDDMSACFVCYAEPVPYIASMDVPLQQYFFKATFTLDLKFSYCDARLSSWTGYDSMDLYGMSLYQFCDSEEDQRARTFHKNLILKGQCILTNLKMLAKYGGWVMIYLSASVICDNIAPSPQHIEAVGCVIGTSNEREITSLKQYQENLDNCAVSAFDDGVTYPKSENTEIITGNSELANSRNECVKIPDEAASIKLLSEVEDSDMKWLTGVLDYDRLLSNPMLDDYDEISKNGTENYDIVDNTTSSAVGKDDYGDLAPFVPPPDFDNRLPDSFGSACSGRCINQDFMADAMDPSLYMKFLS